MRKAILLGLTFLFITPNFAYAIEGNENVNREKQELKTNRGQEKKTERLAESTSSGKMRLTEAKLRSCEARTENISKRSTQLMSLVTNMIGKFDAIAVRVQNFYTTKVLPTGKSVSNYDALVADIALKKTAVTDLLTSSQTELTGFDCNSEDPKGAMSEFRTSMQGIKTALHGYRTSIKNLIVAVHSQAGEIKGSGSPEASSSASPVVTATAGPTVEPTAIP